MCIRDSAGVVGAADALKGAAELYNKKAYQEMTPEQQHAFRNRKSGRAATRKRELEERSPLNRNSPLKESRIQGFVGTEETEEERLERERREERDRILTEGDAKFTEVVDNTAPGYVEPEFIPVNQFDPSTLPTESEPASDEYLEEYRKYKKAEKDVIFEAELERTKQVEREKYAARDEDCLLYTSDAADE